MAHVALPRLDYGLAIFATEVLLLPAVATQLAHRHLHAYDNVVQDLRYFLACHPADNTTKPHQSITTRKPYGAMLHYPVSQADSISVQYAMLILNDEDQII
jgi:hypothetical protein